MSNNKYMSMLGMARRAGKLSMGHDTAMKSIRSGKARLLLFAGDISPRLINEFDIASQKYCPGIICIKLNETVDMIHCALGYKAGVITVNDNNFSNRIIQLIQEENVYGNKI